MNYLPKKKRAVYEKEFTLHHVLQNLQGYRLATGSVDPRLLQDRLRQGEDVDKVFGELVTCKPPSSSTTKPQEAAMTNRKRRRKSRRKRKLTSSSLPLNARKADTEDKSSPTGYRTVTGTDASAQLLTSSRTSLLVSYSSSGESDAGVKSGRPEAIGHLSIPAAIQDLYEDDNEPVLTSPWKRAEESELEEPHALDSDKNESLGFFESCSDPDDDEEGNGGGPQTSLSLMAPLRERIPEVTKQWSDKKSQWVFGLSQLSSYTCWKCSNVGHLAQDCTVAVGASRCSADPGGSGAMAGGSSVTKIPRLVQDLLATCREMKRKKGQQCAHCGICSNLVACLDCGSILCDGRGHLVAHLLSYSSHRKLYSFKLKRLLKCCKPTCDVVDIYDLLMCSHCLGKAFSQHYSMMNAVWSRAGLVKVSNAISCEEHFQWHRMNCDCVGDEHFVDEHTLQSQLNSEGMLSEFFF